MTLFQLLFLFCRPITYLYWGTSLQQNRSIKYYFCGVIFYFCSSSCCALILYVLFFFLYCAVLERIFFNGNHYNREKSIKCYLFYFIHTVYLCICSCCCILPPPPSSPSFPLCSSFPRLPSPPPPSPPLPSPSRDSILRYPHYGYQHVDSGVEQHCSACNRSNRTKVVAFLSGSDYDPRRVSCQPCHA